jgi:cell division septum initiation protein DivIVA
MSAYEELMAQRGDGAEPTSPAGPAAPTEPAAGPEEDAASGGMARLLEIAARNADELLAEAETEAEQVRSTARVEAERMLSEARTEAERIRAESETAKSDATQQIAGLRQTEREHRERMKAHLQEMLAKVEANSIG